MTSGPSLKRRPAANPAVDLERLDRLDSWTAEPAIAQAVATRPPVAEGQGRAPEQPVVAAPPPAPVAQQAYPWVGKQGLQQTNFRLPLELYHQLKFLGDTTYGESMTDIVIKALREEVARRLKERGIEA